MGLQYALYLFIKVHARRCKRDATIHVDDWVSLLTDLNSLHRWQIFHPFGECARPASRQLSHRAMVVCGGSKEYLCILVVDLCWWEELDGLALEKHLKERRQSAEGSGAWCTRSTGRSHGQGGYRSAYHCAEESDDGRVALIRVALGRLRDASCVGVNEARRDRARLAGADRSQPQVPCGGGRPQDGDAPRMSRRASWCCSSEAEARALWLESGASRAGEGAVKRRRRGLPGSSCGVLNYVGTGKE